MFIDYTPEQRQLRDELRAYFERLITPDVLAENQGSEGGGPLYTKALRQMGADGWLGVGWPKEYGGLQRSAINQYIFFDEVQRTGFPIPFLTLCTVGPTLIKFGTSEQKAKMLPRILKGELHFAIGYSESGAGTDLAALTTKAVRDGDDYIVSGQKVFTSLAEYADYIWLAVRTDPAAPKHKGISILMVDTKSPGFSLSPIHTLGGNRTNVTYYDNVRVPASMRVAGENDGWKLITMQLNHERVALLAPGPVTRFVEEVIDWAKENRTADGRRVIDQPWVQTHLARARAHVEVLTLLAWRHASKIDHGTLDPAEASTVKVFGSESFVQIYSLLLEVLGPLGIVKAGSRGAILRGRIETYYRTTLVLTFGGGVNEVQRDIIAMAGLGLPGHRDKSAMDFELDETQKAVADLAKKIFDQRLGPDVLKKVDADESRFLRPLWDELAQAGLLGTAIPESCGGSGQGFLSLCALLEQVGAAVAPLPIFATLALGALPLAEFGTPEQCDRILPGVTRGETILSAALIEAGSSDPLRPSASAAREKDQWVIRGTKICVQAAHLASRILVPARTADGKIGVFLVDPRAPGVKIERQVTTTGEPLGELELSGVRVNMSDVLGDPERGGDVLEWLVPRATVALSAMELGVAERALRMTAEYTTTRRQFDRPIATFQAVAQRAADAYIDVETIRVATWHAAYRLSAGLPASEAVAIAKYFACEAGHRVVYAAQHLHGGIGFDLDYPLHRYYLWSKQIELTLGSAATHLARLGAELARQ